MRVLFVHQNFPGQYKHIAAALAQNPENDVVALAVSKNPAPLRVRVKHYVVQVPPGSPHPIAADFHNKVIWGEAAARAAIELRSEGFHPDIICGHPGWGEMLFLRDIWPSARVLSFMEFYFHSAGSDFDFGRSSEIDVGELFRLRIRNVPLLMSIEASDWSVTPTVWQWKQLPKFARQRTSVIHDGVDTSMFRPNQEATITLGRDSVVCRAGDEIVTFVNRNLEPYRGYHTFLRALPEILSRRPKARVVIVGADGVSYGKRPPPGTTWRAIFMKEMAAKLDISRVHFVGQIPYTTYLKLLQVSSAHVYLTYPFVLSWSMLEAMSCGCLVVGSRTAPVTEMLSHGENGLLVDFFSPQEVAEAVVGVLSTPGKYEIVRKHARETITSKYDLQRCLPKHLSLVSAIAQGEVPPHSEVAATAQ